MKHITITTLAAMLLGTAGAFAVESAAYTKPSGFVTHTLKAGQFNLIGLTLHEPIAVTGAFETVSGATLTDSDVNFDTALTAETTYILEIIDAADTSLNGTIQEVTDWSGNTVTTPQNLVTEGLAVGDKYQMRKASTLADVFGASNSSGLPAAASSAGSAVVWVQDVNDASGFAKYYYNTGGFGQAAKWKKLNAGAAEVDVAADDIIIAYVDAIFVQMPSSSADTDIVVIGAVKVGATSVVVDRPFNYVSGGFAVGSTLQNSGLENSLAKSASAAGSDIVWIQQVDGTYKRYYYNTGGFGTAAEWKLINADGAEVAAPAAVDLGSAVIIQKNGVDVNVAISPGYNL